ncbi:UDP-2,3-diacylglucosamine diphosphatase [Hippea maritima]|uniref:Metallophosphoesterase n=1 Tax=Hippea maritima (strain ATCC 700847 / DSM 10411 / MH2) TaxID=760142 RepID=F2LVX3_HIPMA|nr:UDP-2,3-diacylglucosamine diphosphatase [Hippea maritima]AEA33907.1 metallophosphoesterase [Hippea maritima DSM 10411]
MKCLFVSDAHYPKSDAIVRFLSEKYTNYDTIYILGDLFEFFYGYDSFVYSHHLRLINLLAQIGKSRRLVLFEGNHEYRFEGIKRYIEADVVKEFLEEDIDGFRVVLSHGDTIDKKDIFYRLFRGFLKSRPTLTLINLLPAYLLFNLSQKASNFSKRRIKSKKYRGTEAACLEFAQRKLKKGADVVILAHTHTPVFKKINNGLYINTGDFFENFSYVEYETTKGFFLKRWNDE